MTRMLTLMTAGLVGIAACASQPETPYDHGEVTPPEPLTAHPDSSDWAALFADDLSGTINRSGGWRFDEDGVLTTYEEGDLFTEAVYDDFILDLEFKTGEEANSGVIVYASTTHLWIPNSIEIQVHDSYDRRDNPDRSIHECGSIYGHVPPRVQNVNAPGEWNRMTIRCVGPFVDVVMNGEHVATMDMRAWTSATVNPDGSEIPEWLSRPKAALEPRGHIGLQGLHGDNPVYYRNLRVLELE